MQLYDEIFHWVYLSSYPPIINKIACCQRLLKWDLAQQVTDEKKQTMPRAYDNMPHGQERLRQEEEEGKLPKLLLNSCFARKDGQESARLAWHYFCHPIFCPPSTRYKRVSSSMSENYLSTRRPRRMMGRALLTE